MMVEKLRRAEVIPRKKSEVCAVSPYLRRTSLAKLDGFAFPSRVFKTDGRNLHYIDTGQGPYRRTAVCLHSRYGWSYSFRKIIPTLLAQKFRVIALDLLGFGFSDKPADCEELSISAQCERVAALCRHLNLDEISIIGHEMGAGIGAQMPRLLKERVAALIFANPAGRIFADGWPGLHLWRTLINASSDLNPSRELDVACRHLRDEERRSYAAPLVDPNGLVAIRHFHDTIILDPDEPDYKFVQAGYDWLKSNWTGRMVTIVGAGDPVFGVPSAERFCSHIGCKRGPIVLQDAGAHPFDDDPDCIKLALDQLFEA